ncbi:ABC-type nitrate/sulfonate/bicarbonate transport system, ATPase component [Frankia torreyi]|uniref:ABC-type nitrate/sulfonate/bicarbonate transport system, ATPase component n=1 Tax=Frankia torreyi TaxID=1856 RepID=A0A0D8B7U2_9ACTN|nr:MULTISPECIES: ABC transporter ATP-binding protein [Frankia]KJE20185.1 ABC-type nitrate/sulfonate/bicarbonate transport system, ATPase component [Frankia torreyi]KQC34943.1 sulfonate ABC transporter ATP-binding protein [Frankia sp. ACN1ag]
MTSSTTLRQESVRETRAPVEVRGLHRAYGARQVIRGLDLRVQAGEFLCLLGPSGCGKTTLLRTLAGLDAADAGEVDVPTQVAIVFQEPRLLPWKRVDFNVRFGVAGTRGARAQALAALEEVGLADHADAWPGTLSGGQAQRVALARALVREPHLLLLDEPFAALDALTRIRMQALVRELVDRHRPATVLVTHDVEEAILLGDRVLVMAEGRIVRDSDTTGITRDAADAVALDVLRRDLLRELGVGG